MNVIINQNVLLNKRKEVIVISIVSDFDIVDNILISFHVCRNIVILILLLCNASGHTYSKVSHIKNWPTQFFHNENLRYFFKLNIERAH